MNKKRPRLGKNPQTQQNNNPWAIGYKNQPVL